MSEKDNTELKPAEENPWYVLATLHGKNPDEATQKRNKSSWHNFFKYKLAGKTLNDEVNQLFKHRLPDQPLPNPAEGIDFSDTEFKEPLNLTAFEFLRYADFSNSKFNKGINLTHAQFNSSANFSYAKFFMSAQFVMVQVSKHANFYQSDFYAEECSKDSAELPLSFDKAVFKHFCGFVNTTFHSPISFNNCQFIGPCNLSGAKFKNKYPALEGAVLHQKTTVSAKKENWPDPQNCDQNPEQAKATCEILREQMEAQGLHEQAHFFFRREMHFSRKAGSFWQAIPNWFFYFLSDYGYSILRPVLGLLSCWITGALIYFDTTKLTFGGAMGLSVSNLLQITGIQRVYWSDFIECLPWGLKFLGGAQTLLAIPLLFLLLLGLRNRFRLK
jgi:uncharacterized protein YjbI with pentapeptide repeats